MTQQTDSLLTAGLCRPLVNLFKSCIGGEFLFSEMLVFCWKLQVICAKEGKGFFSYEASYLQFFSLFLLGASVFLLLRIIWVIYLKSIYFTSCQDFFFCWYCDQRFNGCHWLTYSLCTEGKALLLGFFLCKAIGELSFSMAEISRCICSVSQGSWITVNTKQITDSIATCS